MASKVNLVSLLTKLTTYMKKKLLLAIGLVSTALIGKSNNITVSSATLTGQNTTSNTIVANFDVAWENSWRTSTNESNYDGAWVFIKFRKNGTTDWRHCTLNTTGFVAGTGAVITVPSDGKGAFVYRSTNGIGNVNFTGNQLVWNYGADGLLDNETVELRVFALEMVYITQGAYYLGSGGSETNCFRDGSSSNAFQVTSNNAISLGTTAGTLNPNGQGTPSGTIPAAFPKGFNAFWIMKYECSQQQYVDFLNHLDLARASANYYALAAFTGTHPNLIAPEPERAIGYLGMGKVASLADWSGLRPMTELEHEKACRGYNTPPVPNEYAWGNTTLNPLVSVNDLGLTNESVSTPVDANAALSLASPVRTGIFARPSGSTRELSGGTYYGVMNMSDNMVEICVTIVNAQGLAFTDNVHGDGFLASNGRTDINTWLPFQAFGYKGSSFNSGNNPDFPRTSYRGYTNAFVSFFGADSDQAYFGARLVRTAP